MSCQDLIDIKAIFQKGLGITEPNVVRARTYVTNPDVVEVIAGDRRYEVRRVT